MNAKTQQNEAGAALGVASGSPPFSFAHQMSKVAYQRSADVNDPKNANADWRAGYAEGRYTDTESMAAITQEWSDRGEPNPKTNHAFTEWKIGFWAGRFTKIDDKRAASANK